MLTIGEKRALDLVNQLNDVQSTMIVLIEEIKQMKLRIAAVEEKQDVIEQLKLRIDAVDGRDRPPAMMA